MRGAVMSRGSSRGPGTTRRPSCSNIVSVSIWNQCSAAFPSTIRLISRPEKQTLRPVGGRPRKWPVWVPVNRIPLRVHLLIGHGVLHVEVQVGDSLEKGVQERD